MPFQLQYMIDPSSNPSDADLENIQAITARFLDEILRLNYDFNAETTLDNFELMFITNVDDNGVVTVDYEATVTFGMDSTVVPNFDDVESQIAAAFMETNNDVYLDLMQNTPDSNSFASSTEVIYMSVTPMKRTARVGTVQRFEITATELVGVLCSGVIVLGGMAIMYWERNRRRADRMRKVSLTI